eukprot:2314163-Rhodomonas_salina.1
MPHVSTAQAADRTEDALSITTWYTDLRVVHRQHSKLRCVSATRRNNHDAWSAHASISPGTTTPDSVPSKRVGRTSEISQSVLVAVGDTATAVPDSA